MKSKCFILVYFLLVLLLAPGVFADQRSYVWTYEYKTVEKGNAEVESYFTTSAPDINDLEGNTSVEHRIELEVGMTDHWDFSVYQIFEQPAGGNFRYKRYQFKSRYRIGEKGQLPVDPLLYFEYKGQPDFSKHGIEFKLILAKDIGKINIALNPIFEIELEDGEWEAEVEYAAGVSYEITELFRAGFEVKGSENGHYIGPVISHGVRDRWVALGSAFELAGVKEGKPEFQIRMLLGIGFGE